MARQAQHVPTLNQLPPRQQALHHALAAGGETGGAAVAIFMGATRPVRSSLGPPLLPSPFSSPVGSGVTSADDVGCGGQISSAW